MQSPANNTHLANYTEVLSRIMQTMNTMTDFLVEDPDGSIVRISYLVETPKQIFITMELDALTEWASNVDPEYAKAAGYHEPESIVDYDEFSPFMLRAFQEMARCHHEMGWDGRRIVYYGDFLETLLEADMVAYDEEGKLVFTE